MHMALVLMQIKQQLSESGPPQEVGRHTLTMNHSNTKQFQINNVSEILACSYEDYP